MATSEKKTRRKGARGESLFLTKSQLAHEVGDVDTKTIDEWVAAGTFPPPHSRPGERTSLWRRAHFDVYVATGSWPEESFRSGSGA